WSDVIDRFPRDSRGEQLTKPKRARIILDRHAPSQGVRESRQGFQRDGQHQSPAGELNVGKNLASAEVGYEPDVKAERKQDQDGFEAAHQNKPPKPGAAAHGSILSAARCMRNPINALLRLVVLKLGRSSAGRELIDPAPSPAPDGCE